LIEGIAAVLIGFFLLVSPGITTLVLVHFLGFYWLISGILDIVDIFRDNRRWGWKLCSGILGTLAGLIVIRDPLWSKFLVPTILVILLGIGGVVMGITKLVQAFQGAGLGAFVLGILNILIGIILLGAPLIAVIVLPYILGFFAFIGGIVAIMVAFRVRKAPTPYVEPTPIL